MSYLGKILESYASLVQKRYKIILLVVLFFTVFISYGITNIDLESDIQKQMPQDLPIYKLNDRIENKFSGQSTIFLLFVLDEDISLKQSPKDILDPQIMEYVLNLESILEKDNRIDSVTSLSPIINSVKEQQGDITARAMADALENSPEGKGLVSDDRKKMIMILGTSVGESEKETEEINQLIDEKLNALSNPPSTKIMVTGNPPLMNTILGMLRHDAVYTLAIAFVIIFGVLTVLQRSVNRAILVSLPILLAITWTAGTLGWLGIKLSFATAGLGAMVLGLGVEYGIFMLTRYREENSKKDKIKALKETIPTVGAAIVGSGSTTMIGFLALTLSIIPMMQNLGLSLAIGIFFCIIATVLIQPAFFILSEKITGEKV